MTKFKQLGVRLSFELVTLVTAALLLAWAGWLAQTFARLDPSLLLMMLLLIGGTLLAAQFPIHLRHNIKLMVTTMPLFLLAVLLPPPVSALAAGFAMLGVSLVLHSRLGSTGLDIVTTVGRWIVNAWLGSAVSHLVTDVSHLALLGFVSAAIIMFFSEVIGTAFEIAPTTGESPPHLIRTLIREGGFAEAVQYILAIGGAALATRELWTLLLLAVPLVFVYWGFKRAKEMQESTRLILQDMADAVEQRDPYTGGHSRRVTEMCRALLSQLAMNGPEADLIITAARVHDIGKINVPDEILTKPGPLKPQERAIMENHVKAGADLLKRYPNFARGAKIVLHHHERWDGLGYPSGLKAQEIPLGARIIAVADSFDAMTTPRPYRRAFSPDKARQTLREGKGTQWDPRIVDAFLELHLAPTPEPAQTQPAFREREPAA